MVGVCKIRRMAIVMMVSSRVAKDMVWANSISQMDPDKRAIL